MPILRPIQHMTTTDFLIIEPFLHDAIQARTLQAAFELGIIDALESSANVPVSQLLRGRSCDAAGGKFLLQVLARSGVVQLDGASVQLTETFRSALRFRDLLLTKLQSGIWTVGYACRGCSLQRSDPIVITRACQSWHGMACGQVQATKVGAVASKVGAAAP